MDPSSLLHFLMASRFVRSLQHAEVCCAQPAWPQRKTPTLHQPERKSSNHSNHSSPTPHHYQSLDKNNFCPNFLVSPKKKVPTLTKKKQFEIIFPKCARVIHSFKLEMVIPPSVGNSQNGYINPLLLGLWPSPISWKESEFRPQLK